MLTSKVFSSKYLNVFTRNGWLFASRNKEATDLPPTQPNAVAMCGIVITPNEPNRVVIIREFRIPLQGFELALPAGLIDPGESVEQTAVREFKEETGLDFIPSGLTSPLKLSSSAGLSDELCPVVFGTASGKVSDHPGIHEERISVLVLTREELKASLKSDDYFSGRSWAILYALAHEGKFGPLTL